MRGHVPGFGSPTGLIRGLTTFLIFFVVHDTTLPLFGDGARRTGTANQRHRKQGFDPRRIRRKSTLRLRHCMKWTWQAVLIYSSMFFDPGAWTWWRGKFEKHLGILLVDGIGFRSRVLWWKPIKDWVSGKIRRVGITLWGVERSRDR